MNQEDEIKYLEYALSVAMTALKRAEWLVNTEDPIFPTKTIKDAISELEALKRNWEVSKRKPVPK